MASALSSRARLPESVASSGAWSVPDVGTLIVPELKLLSTGRLICVPPATAAGLKFVWEALSSEGIDITGVSDVKWIMPLPADCVVWSEDRSIVPPSLVSILSQSSPYTGPVMDWRLDRSMCPSLAAVM